MAGGERIKLPGAPGVEVALRRSPRARRLSLRVSALDGQVTLTIPRRLDAAEAMAFVRDRQDWILAARERAPDLQVVGVGSVIPVEGRPVTVAAGKGLRRDGSVLHVPEGRAARAARAYLRTLARDRLVAASDRHAAAIGRSYTAVALRDARSRWGSCSSAGRLMYSWRLILAPPEILDYVAAHEVAHLERMDHSPAFWAVVAGLCPDWTAHRAWLRANGAELHRHRFDD